MFISVIEPCSALDVQMRPTSLAVAAVSSLFRMLSRRERMTAACVQHGVDSRFDLSKQLSAASGQCNARESIAEAGVVGEGQGQPWALPD